MADLDPLLTLRRQLADAYLLDSVVGTNALCVLGGWRWEGDGRVLVTPKGPLPKANRGVPDPGDNPAISLDAALALAEQTCPTEWPGILRSAITAQTSAHRWWMELPKPGQRQQLARAVLLALIEHLVAEAEGSRQA